MTGKKGMKRYPAELKLEAVRLFDEQGYSWAQITAALDIRDPERVKKWLAQYRAEGASAFVRPVGRPRQGTQAELERLKMEVALLKKLHSELRELPLAQRNIGRSTTSGRNLP